MFSESEKEILKKINTDDKFQEKIKFQNFLNKNELCINEFRTNLDLLVCENLTSSELQINYLVKGDEKDLNFDIQHDLGCLCKISLFIEKLINDNYFTFVDTSEYLDRFPIGSVLVLRITDEETKAKILKYCHGYFVPTTKFKEFEIQKQNVTKKHNNSVNNGKITVMDNNKVFIVHGHDENLVHEVENFLRKIKLVPIVLHEQANNGLTIIEKLEKYSDVSFAIILYTPCDEGYAKENKEPKPRARQNVVFEHGYFVAKLGRERIVALHKDGVELPGDLSGLIYEKYIENSNDWKLNIIQELKEAGFTVSADDLLMRD